MADHDQRFKVATLYDRMLQRQFREMLQVQLETRFGPLSPQLQQRLESLPVERLRELLLAFAKGQSLQEMGLAE